MRKLILTVLVACSLLLLQSCSKKESAFISKDGSLNSSKRPESVPAGCMSGVLPTGTYKFISYVSTVDPAINKSIGVTGGSTAAGALIEQRDFAGTAQEWRITQTGYGTYSVINYNSGLALDNQGHGQGDNNPIEQWPFTNGNAAQEWVIEYQGGFGLYRFKVLDNLNMGLHVAGGSTANGANLVLKTFATSTPAWGYFFAYAMPISNPPITLHTPDATHKDAYPRVLTLPNGNLLASFQYADTNMWNSSSNLIKMYRSINGGSSWTALADLTDTHRGFGFQDATPFVMPVTIGSVPAGTLICGVESNKFLDVNFIDIYRSNDNGTTWTYMSNVAGGNGWGHDIWEPFFLVDGYGRLICYYSDERDAAHSQKLVYQISNDGGVSWSPTVYDVVAVPLQSDRPGMFRASKMGNGKWIMDYEDWDPNTPGIYYKTSTDGANWNTVPSDRGTRVTSLDGAIPKGTPGILWTPAGSTSGTVIVTSGAQDPASFSGTENYVNFNYGTGNWYRVPQPLPYNAAVASAGYSRTVGMSADGKTLYHINSIGIDSKRCKIQFVATPAW